MNASGSEAENFKSDGTISYEIGLEPPNDDLAVKVYFVPDTEHIEKIGGKNYAKFRTYPKQKRTDLRDGDTKNCYDYRSILLEMNEDHVELRVNNKKLKSRLCLSAPAIAAKATRLTAEIKLKINENFKEVELVGIKVPAKISKSVG